LELLPYLSQEQVTKFVDYDCWSKDRLSPAKVANWLKLFGEQGNEQMAKRFRDLDEELQLAFLGPLVRLYELDEFEKLPQEEQDKLHALPGGELWYSVTEPELERSIEGLVNASLEVDVGYTISMLAHATYMPPNEQEDLERQFRQARLEEDGFVTFEEALRIFLPLPDALKLVDKWRVETAPQSLPTTTATEAVLLDQALDLVREQGGETLSTVSNALMHGANTLCAVADIAPDDFDGLREVIGYQRSLVNLGLEILVGTDSKRAAQVLTTEHPMHVLRLALTTLGHMQIQMLEKLSALGWIVAKDWRILLGGERRGELLLRCDRVFAEPLGLELVENLKGFFNRFPIAAVLGSDGREQQKAISSLKMLRQAKVRLEALLLIFSIADRTLGVQAKSTPDLLTHIRQVLGSFVQKGATTLTGVDLSAVLGDFVSSQKIDLAANALSLEPLVKGSENVSERAVLAEASALLARGS
jgi:hypothetical protein